MSDLGAGVVRTEPGTGVQGADFLQHEISNVGGRPGRIAGFDIGGAGQGGVMNDDQFAVAASLHIDFDKIGLDPGGEVDGGKCVFRCVGGCSAVRDDGEVIRGAHARALLLGRSSGRAGREGREGEQAAEG